MKEYICKVDIQVSHNVFKKDSIVTEKDMTYNKINLFMSAGSLEEAPVKKVKKVKVKKEEKSND